MVNMKRTLTSNESSEENMKKLRNELSSVENLSNEIFYEIFDYLDGLDICQAFSNVNSRFQQLIKCSSIRYKINLGYSTRKEKFLNNYKEIQHQISSISFIVPKKSMNEFLTIDYSFNNLQSIRIDNIDKDKLISLLIYLSGFPCLYSLDVQTTDSIEDLNQIYQLIFSLPKLKSNKLSLNGDEYSISIPISDKKQISPIEDLHISHSYTFDELSALISYTPSLRRLNLSHSNKDDDEDIEDIFPIHLNHLIGLSMFTNSLNFDELQFFIEQFNSKLKYLHIVVFYRDLTYLHAYRWQQFIQQNFPQLEKFSLRYRESGFSDAHQVYDGGVNQFISPFWIQRNLIFDIEIHEYNNDYYIRPYKTRWYQDINSSIEHSKSSQLTIKYVYFDEPVFMLLDQVKRALNFAQIYHLTIEQQICDEILKQIIHLLPNLITLNLNSLALDVSEFLCEREFPSSSALEHAKNIKYVCLEKAHSIEDIDFLMSFCPEMEYLNVECITMMNIETFLKDILNKINQTHHECLRLLCIYVTTADDQMIKQLNKMIDDEKLLFDYTIHRQLYNIYLKWK